MSKIIRQVMIRSTIHRLDRPTDIDKVRQRVLGYPNVPPTLIKNAEIMDFLTPAIVNPLWQYHNNSFLLISHDLKEIGLYGHNKVKYFTVTNVEKTYDAVDATDADENKINKLLSSYEKYQ